MVVKEAVNNKFVSWDSVETFVDILCDQITQSGKQVEYIFGMPRGGLIPAVILSHRLGIPMTQELTRQNTLVIDDICDSGETFKELFLKNPDAIFACLHFKPHTSAFNPNFAANIFPSDNWIVYPWEQDD